jgi:hypothetical protein
MEINSFVFHLIMAITPGYMSYSIFKHLKTIGKSDFTQKDWLNFFLLFVFAVLDISILESLISVHNHFFINSWESVLNKLYDEKKYFSINNLFALFIISIVVGAIGAIFYNKKLLYKVAKRLGITSSYGEEDVWTLTVGAKEIEWVFVRDHKYDKIYFGHIEKYSDTNTERELTLTEVSVYDNITGKELYSIPRLYLCRDKYELTIEEAPKGEENAKLDESAKTTKRRIGKKGWN